MPKGQDEFGRGKHVKWAQEKQRRCRWGQTRMDFQGQFRNLNPVSRAMGNLNDHTSAVRTVDWMDGSWTRIRRLFLYPNHLGLS